MAIAGLVLGILSVSVFFWAGPTIGGLWSASEAVSASLAGNAAMPPAWPVWVMGLSLGVGLPLISVILSVAGLRSKKGVAIAGLVTSSVGVILGFLTTLGAAFAINMAAASKDKLDDAMPDLQQMQNTIDDPAFQDRIQKAMKAAAAQGDTAADPQAPAAGTPNALMPGQVPASPSQAESAPVEAPPAEAPPAEAPTSSGP